MGLLDFLKRAPPPAALPTPRSSEHTVRHAAAVLDHLALLHPEAPERLTVRARLKDRKCLIARVDVARAGLNEAPAALADDARLRTALLATAAQALWGSLGFPDDGDTQFDLQATASAVTLQGLSIEVPAQSRLHGPDFLRWLRGASSAIAQKQSRLQAVMAALGTFRWSRDAARFESGTDLPLSVRAEVLGSYAPSEQSWCWAWANRALAGVNHAALAQVRAEARLPLLTVPGFPCTEPFAFAVAHAASEQLQPALAVFRWPQRSGAQLFFGVGTD